MIFDLLRTITQKQLSSPTISHDGNEDHQSDGSDIKADDDDDKDDDQQQQKYDAEASAEIALHDGSNEIEKPLSIIYHDRNILDLGSNVAVSRDFVSYTVLPENNVQMFFQNRAQYWRLGANGERQEYSCDKCFCCDFTYPITQGPSPPKAIATASASGTKNAITDSILTFLKSTEFMTQQYHQIPQQAAIPNNHLKQQQQRMYSNNNNVNNGPFGYQMHQQQYQNGSFYNYNSNSNNFGAATQQMGPFGSTANTPQPASAGNNYNGTALALLNLMNNASRNGHFPAMSNNNSRALYGGLNGVAATAGATNNNNWGLYKQF